MKGLSVSVEEKAARYDAAIERAKNTIEVNQTIPDIVECVESLFPELKESEDERIRKDIVTYLKSVIDNKGYRDEIIESWIAWLEKQGEQNTIVVIPKFRVGDVIRPKGSMAEYTIESISGECYYGKGWGLHISCDNDYELVEQKPAWSEEDEQTIEDAEIWLDTLCDYLKDNSSECISVIKDVINKLKSLRPQSNIITDEELAQAEKEAYNNVLDKMEYNGDNPTFDDGWSAAIWYLKKRNAQPQNGWKPSDEQIEYLAKAITTLGDEGDCKTASILNDLRVELKKLKE